MFIYSHNYHSRGADALKEALGARKIRHENSTFVGAARKTVINWGSSNLPPEVMRCNVINRPEAVGLASHKLRFFEAISVNNRDDLPEWTASLDDALLWVARGAEVVARTVLQGSGGEGIVLMSRDNPAGFVRAPLYTKYIKKQHEYRIHVINGRVVDFQRKVISRERAESAEPINWKIRNLENGFIYQREGTNPPQSVQDMAIRTMRTIGLYFGGVDIVWNDRDGRGYVLEVNSAPGLTGTTVQSYANALRNL